MIPSLQEAIDKEVLKLQLPDRPRELYEPIRYILDLGGKRIRPLLTLLSCQLFGGDPLKAMNQAIAVEIFHNFSLMHDDIMDEAPLRRGKETVHSHWNQNVAILSGDAMLIISYQYLQRSSEEQLDDLLRCFNSTALKVCDGQQFDMEFENRDDVSVEEYLKMISLKTAALLAGSLQLGAIQANAGKEAQEKIALFGHHLGIAFQLQDDYLDAYGDPKSFGKQVGGDILGNKKTILYLSALESTDEALKAELRAIYHQNKLQGQAKIDRCLELFELMGSKSKVAQMKEEHFEKAIESLKACSGDSEVEAQLIMLAEKLHIRST
jgi:geranylgeranyl diphosphate synthase type II